jgi:uncharacterized protein
MNRRSLLLTGLACPALAQSLGAQGETLAPGWRMDTLIRWGDAVLPDAPAWNPGSPGTEAAAGQFGWDAKVVAAIQSPGGADGVSRLVLAVAHPMVDPIMAFPDGRDRPEVAAAMQGASIINLDRRGGAWVVASGGFQARRLTGATLCRMAGPGAGGAVTGLFGVCGGAAGPGSRLLLTEGEATDWAPRLPGRIGAGHGWVVELNPADPSAIPVKRTALGRGAVDVAATATADGRAIVYLAHPAGLARFISASAAVDPDALDQGALSAARLGPGGSAWVPLPEGAWQDLAAALRGAQATALMADVTLHHSGGTLLVTSPRAGTVALRPMGDDAAAERIIQAGQGGSAGQSAALGDSAGRVWLALGDGRLLRGGQSVLTAPRGAVLGGLALSADGTTLFTGIRAPGREAGRSFGRPATRWPDFIPGVPPRSALVALSQGL